MAITGTALRQIATPTSACIGRRMRPLVTSPGRSCDAGCRKSRGMLYRPLDVERQSRYGVTQRQMVLTNAQRQARWRERHIRKRRAAQRVVHLLLRKYRTDVHIDEIAGLLHAFFNRDDAHKLRRRLRELTDSRARIARHSTIAALQDEKQAFERDHPGKRYPKHKCGLTDREATDLARCRRQRARTYMRAVVRKLRQSLDMRYRSRVPRKVKAGYVLVHNHIAHTKDMASGINGFRFWTQKRNRDVARCNCGWQGVPHYRIRGTSKRIES